MSNYNFNIIYRPGRNNKDADGLSRVPEDVQIDKESIKAISNSTYTQGLVESIAIDTNVFQQTISESDMSDTTKIDWKQRQDADELLRKW